MKKRKKKKKKKNLKDFNTHHWQLCNIC